MKTNALFWIVVGAVAAVPCAAQMQLENPFGSRFGGPPELQVTPTLAHTSDEVSATVRGWVPASNYCVSSVDKRIEGSDIYLDLYWVAPGIGMCVITPFEYTVSLGTFDPGIYTVHYGDATATFTVIPSSSLPTPPTIPDTDPDDLLEQRRQEMLDRLNNPGGSAPELPGFEIVHVPWSDMTSIKEGISQLRISPSAPTPSDVVSVTVSGWKGSRNFVIGHAEVWPAGQTISLNLYWYDPSAPPEGSIDQSQASAQSITIIQYDPTPPYEGVPYEHTESLGTFAAGTYTLNVANHGEVSGSKSTSFTVKPATGQGQQWPAWITEMLSR